MCLRGEGIIREAHRTTAADSERKLPGLSGQSKAGPCPPAWQARHWARGKPRELLHPRAVAIDFL